MLSHMVNEDNHCNTMLLHSQIKACITKSSYIHLSILTRSTLHEYCWWRGIVVSGVHRMNKVNAHRARLVPGWVTIFGRVYHLGM